MTDSEKLDLLLAEMQEMNQKMDKLATEQAEMKKKLERQTMAVPCKKYLCSVK